MKAGRPAIEPQVFRFCLVSAQLFRDEEPGEFKGNPPAMLTPPPRNQSLIRLKIKGSWRIQSSRKALFLGKEVAVPIGNIHVSFTRANFASKFRKKKSESYIFLSCLNLNYIFYLVVSTQLKHISQIGSFPQVGVKIKNIWNHQPVFLCFHMFPHVSYNSKYSYRNHHFHLCDFHMKNSIASFSTRCTAAILASRTWTFLPVTHPWDWDLYIYIHIIYIYYIYTYTYMNGWFLW